MNTDQIDDALNVLACDIEMRPKDAPSFFDLQHSIRAVRREGDGLRVEFDPAEAAAVRQLVEAERRCCAEIGWDLQQSPSLTLVIRATPAQLDVFEQFIQA